MKEFKYGDIVRERESGILAEVTAPYSDGELYLIELGTGSNGISKTTCYDPEDFDYVTHKDGKQWLDTDLIDAETKSGQRVVYTKSVLGLLMNDDFIRHILDLKTGELLK